jgi:hypothetical protein
MVRPLELQNQAEKESNIAHSPMKTVRRNSLFVSGDVSD